ncbi:MAG: 3-oxoacyl-ACP synthase, partial [Clostridia bacterium]
MNARIIGTGHYVPPFVLTNEGLESIVDTSDEWIFSHTGIKERHICQSETVWEMALHAAENALESAAISAEEIDIIIG